MTVRGVDHDGVHEIVEQRFDPCFEVGSDADGGRHAQPTERILGGEGVIGVLVDVLHGDQPDQAPIGVDEGELLDSMDPQNGLGLSQCRRRRRGDETLRGHEIADRPIEVAGLHEPGVAVGEDADQATIAIGDRHARDMKGGHHLFGVAHRGRRPQRDRIGDHARL